MAARKTHKIIIFFVLLPMFFVGKNSHGQSYSPSEIKTAYIFNFIKLITWPDENSISQYNVAILSSDTALIVEMIKNANIKKVKNKEIEIHKISNLENISDFQAIYISNEYKNENDVKSLLQGIKGKGILLITDKFDLENSMINFFTKQNTIRFEINHENVESNGFKISGLLVTLSKSKNELKELYLQTEKLLETEKKLVEQQKKELEEQKARIDEQRELLREQQAEVEKQQLRLKQQADKLNEQNSLITTKEKEILKQNSKLASLNIELVIQQKKLKERLELTKLQENKIKEQTSKINSQLDVMNKLNKELDRKLEEISDKNSVLSEQNVKIYNQRLTITLSFIFIGIVFLLIVLVLRAYKAKIKVNRELAEKNDAITKQNIEIRQQQEEILSQNEEIERQRANLEINQKEIQNAYRKIEEKSTLLEIRNRYITDGIQYAQKIQESIFPSLTLIKSVFPESFILFLPKDILSGDFYFFDKTFSQDDEETYRNEEIIYFAAVDCTGHGVPGALMSIVGYNLLNQAINEYKIKQPSKILDFLSTGVQNTLRQSDDDDNVKDGMDIALCKYNKNTNILEYAGAFNPLYVYRDNELIEYKADIRPIGSSFQHRITPFNNHKIKLQKGDTLYLFSDGYADQFGGKDQNKFMRKRLRNLLYDNHSLPMQEQKQVLKDVFFQWKGELEQYDDVLIIGIRI